MKKLIIVLLTLLFSAGICQADWEITVKDWTMSPGPDLAYEMIGITKGSGTDPGAWDKYGINPVEGCENIKPEDPKTCTWTKPIRDGRDIWVVSIDTNGNYAKHLLGNLGIGPAPSTGGGVVLIWNASLNKWDVKVFDWTMSPGPALDYEQVHKNGVLVSECGNIKPEDPKDCTFQIDLKGNEEIKIVSFDKDGNRAENIIARTGLGPNPASGGSVTVIWKP